MNNFQEKFKLYWKKRPQRVSVFGLGVFVDWLFILFCSLVLTLVGFIYAFFVYQGISKGTVFNVDIKEKIDTEHEEKERQIDKVVQYLKQRQF